MTKEYCSVIDSNGTLLDPTKTDKAWYLIRKNRAKLLSKYPMKIQLFKEIPPEDVNTDKFICGINDGSKHVGLAVVQQCKTRNKVIFKGTVEHRQDVKKLLDQRRNYRRVRRNHKRYRPARFNNRSASKRTGRVAPSILQKRQAVLRVINNLKKLFRITKFVLEDVAIDIRALTDGYKPYDYQESNRLDENIRKAVILRDGNQCKECGKTNTVLEAHHIRAKRLKGADTPANLITLCAVCHDKIRGREPEFEQHYFSMISGKSIRFDYAQHVMQGKHYLRNQLSNLGELRLTTGGDTANKRIDWDIEKSHSNNAVVITGLKPDTLSVKEWVIKPIRRQSKAKTDNVLGIKHRDLVSYTYRNGEKHTGYVTALYPDSNQLSFKSLTKRCNKVNAKKVNLLWRFNKIYWLEAV